MIRAKTLEVSLQRSSGQMEVVFGSCELSVGDVPDKDAAIAAATAPLKPAATAAAVDGADAADWDDKSGDGQKRKRTDRTQPPPMA